MSGGWKVRHYVMSFIFFLGGLWALIRPVNTFFALASVLGLILIFYGTFEIIRAVASRAVNPYWWIGPDHGHPAHPAGLLGVGIRPGLRPGPAGVPDPVLGRASWRCSGHHADHDGVRDPSRGEDGSRQSCDGLKRRKPPTQRCYRSETDEREVTEGVAGYTPALSVRLPGSSPDADRGLLLVTGGAPRQRGSGRWL